MSRPQPQVTRVRTAGDEHQVVTVEGGRATYRRTPCSGCPWRVDQVGVFPPEAFLHSAETAYDMASHTFACHEAGTDRPQLCAGFLLRGADHNLSIRMRASSGAIDLSAVHEGGHVLHDDYVSMAVANGCDPQHPRLLLCRRATS